MGIFSNKKDIILFILSSVIIFSLLTILFSLRNWITPFYQSDASGSLYSVYEKRYLGKALHYYTPTYNEPGYARGPLTLNDLYYVIVPYLFTHFEFGNILTPIGVLKATGITLAYASACIVTYYLVRNTLFSVILGLLYAFSPFMIFYFVPGLMLSYAVLPLAIVLAFSIYYGKGSWVQALLLYGIFLLLHPHILAFSLLLIIYFLTLLLYKFKRGNARPYFNRVILIVFLFIISIFTKYYLSLYFGSTLKVGMDLLKYERLSHPFATVYLSLDNFVELLGGFNKGGFNAYKRYVKYSDVPDETNLLMAYTVVVVLVIWATFSVIMILRRNGKLKMHVNALGLTIVMAWLLHYILCYPERLLRLVQELQLPVIGGAISNFVYTFRDPYRISAIVFALSVFVFSLSIKSLSAQVQAGTRFRRLKSFVRALAVLIVILLPAMYVFVFNFSPVYLFYKLSKIPGWREWEPWVYESVHAKLASDYGGYFKAAIIDHSVSEPKLLHLGQRLYPDFNHYSYFAGSPSLRVMLRDQMPVVWSVLDSNFESRLLEERGYGAVFHDLEGLDVFYLDRPAVRAWLRVPSTLCRMLSGGPENVSLKVNFSEPVSYDYLKHEVYGDVSEALKDLKGASIFSVEAWVRIYDYGKRVDQVILSVRDSSGNNGFALFYGWGSDLYFRVESGERRVSLRTIVGDWQHVHHIAAVINGGNVSLYVDGEPAARGSVGFGFALPPAKDAVVEYAEMPYGVVLGAGVVAGRAGGVNVSYKVNDSSLRGGYAFIDMALSVETSPCRDIWVPLNIPLLEVDGNASLEGLEGKFFSARVNAGNRSFQTYVYIEKVYRGVGKCNLYTPLFVSGGPNSISVASDLLSRILANSSRGACILPVFRPTASGPGIRVVDVASLYLDLLENSSMGSGEFYREHSIYMRRAKLMLRGFGRRYYWSLPFIGYVPSGVYGEYSGTLYSLVIPRGVTRAELRLPVASINSSALLEGTGYVYPVLTMTVEGKGSITISVGGAGHVWESGALQVNSNIPLQLIVGLGRLSVLGVENASIEIEKDKNVVVSLHKVFLALEPLARITEEAGSAIFANGGSKALVYVVPLSPLPVVVDLSSSKDVELSLERIYWSAKSSLLSNEARGLHVIGGGNIILPPIFLAGGAYDVYVHLYPPIASGGRFTLTVTANGTLGTRERYMFTFNISNSILDDAWVRVGTFNLPGPSRARLELSVESGWINVDAVALVPSGILQEMVNSGQYALVKVYYKYLDRELAGSALMSLNGYTLLPRDLAARASPKDYLDEKWRLLPVLLTIENLYADTSVIAAIAYLARKSREKPFQSRKLSLPVN